MKRTITLAFAAAATFAAAAPAQAAISPTPTKTVQCLASQVSPTASTCSGWWAGNLLPEGGPITNQAKYALAQLGFNWDKVTIIQKIDAGNSAGIIDFTGILSGKTIIGVHRGGNGTAGDPGNATAFFKWDNLAPTDKVQLNLSGLSSQTLYITTFAAVPEPATWLLMIAGVGLVGWQLRRRRQTVKLSYA